MYWIIEFSRKEEEGSNLEEASNRSGFQYVCVHFLAHAETFMKKDKPFWLAGQQVKTTKE